MHVYAYMQMDALYLEDFLEGCQVKSLNSDSFNYKTKMRCRVPVLIFT